MVAYTAPIYVIVDGQSFWKPEAVPEIVAKHKSAMQELLKSKRPEVVDDEAWETREVTTQYWNAQQAPLKARIDLATAAYDDLLQRAVADARRPE